MDIINSFELYCKTSENFKFRLFVNFENLKFKVFPVKISNCQKEVNEWENFSRKRN